jgi:hypothetical protein
MKLKMKQNVVILDCIKGTLFLIYLSKLPLIMYGDEDNSHGPDHLGEVTFAWAVSRLIRFCRTAYS